MLISDYCTQCSDFRTISLMSHVMKALLKIILASNEKKVEAEIIENQSGFRPGKDTRKGIFNLRIIKQRYIVCIYMFHRL